ncbi:MAG TPA: insulinase family protein, partial [Flavisolibacter sp.]|nr:insulinase family protein [Flavisolibacter sp.]
FVEKHRINVLNEISRQESNPFFNATAASSRDAALFGAAHPYGHGVYGSVESNSSLSSLDLKHWFNHYFKAGNMALIVVGNFKVAQAKKLIATYFETIPKGKKSRPHIAFEPMQPLGRIVPVPVQENYAFLFWPGTSLQSTQSAAMLLLAFLMENRLAQLDTMLVKDGECLSSTQFYQHSGSFGVSATFKKIKDSSVIVNRLKMVVESFTKDAVSEMELQRVKKNMRLALQTKLAKLGFTDSRSEMLGEGYVLTGDAGRYLKLYKQALTLVPKDIKAVAKYVLTREPHLQICWSTAHE